LLTSRYSLPPLESVKLISASPLSFVEEIQITAVTDHRFLSAQLGDSERTLKTHYAKWMPDTDDDMAMVEASIAKSQNKVKTGFRPNSVSYFRHLQK